MTIRLRIESLLELRKNKWQCLICRDVAYRDRTVQEHIRTLSSWLVTGGSTRRLRGFWHGVVGACRLTLRPPVSCFLFSASSGRSNSRSRQRLRQLFETRLNGRLDSMVVEVDLIASWQQHDETFDSIDYSNVSLHSQRGYGCHDCRLESKFRKH